MRKILRAGRVIGISALAVAWGLWSGNSYAGSNITTNGGAVLRWPSIPQVQFVINPDGVPGFGGELDRLVVVGAIQDAFRAWTEVPGAAIAFTDGGLSSQHVGDPGGDQVSLVTFQDNPVPPIPAFDPSVLAMTAIFAAPAAGLIELPGGKVVQADFAGQMLDADILFNPNLPEGFFSPVGAEGSIDLEAVAVHEIGHLLGLDHTGIFSSIMNPYAESSGGGVSSRIIQSDDATTIAALYPVQTFAPATGNIFGTITTSTGSAVLAAHVVALSVPGGTPVASQLSGPTGSYSIQGLPPGNYRILVEPLDGPIGLAGNFSDYYEVGGQTNFATAMLGGFANPTTLSVAAGQQVPANVSLPPTPTSVLNVEFLGELVGGSGFFAPATLYLPRGKTHELVAVDSTEATDTSMVFSSPDIARLGPTQGVTFTNGKKGRLQDISIPASAALGPSNLSLSNASSTSVMPGGVVVTLNPTIVAPLREFAGSGTALGPGALASISGTDLAERFAFASSYPLPTNLGGVSVKIGNRFAPLFAVSPTKIIAMVPYELSGQVNVQVVTGPGAGGNTIGVNLSPTAPGIFSTNANGTGQGSIFNSDATLASTGGGGRPAKRGDSVIILGSGLGPVNPASPSGLEAGAAGTSEPVMAHPPTVRIGGQLATVTLAALAPGFAAVYEIVAEVPGSAPLGDTVSVQITTFEGQASNTVSMAVSQ